MTQTANISIEQAVQELQKVTKKKITYGGIANALDVSRQAISNRAARNSVLQDYEWERLKEYFIKDKDIDFNDNKTPVVKDNIEVDYYEDVFGSCGKGTFVLSEAKERMLVPKKFFTSYSPAKQYSIINAYGDSMFPYIHDKDKLIVEHWEGGQIIDNRVYVFRYKDKLYVKRLVDNLQQFIIKSDNTLYEPIKAHIRDIQVIGKIVGVFRYID